MKAITWGHIEAMKMSLFSKHPKFYVDFEKAIKFWEHVDGFEGNCVWN